VTTSAARWVAASASQVMLAMQPRRAPDAEQHGVIIPLLDAVVPLDDARLRVDVRPGFFVLPCSVRTPGATSKIIERA